MSNFVVKNGLSLGGSLKKAEGTITGSATLDLSTGNYFDYTPTADTTFVFSNPPAAGKAHGFALQLTGADIGTSYDLANASYDSVSFSVAAQDGLPAAMVFNNTGTKMYIIGGNNSSAYQYTLSTAYDISTATYDTVSFSFSTQDANPRDVFFKPDGTKMYIVGEANDTVYQYTLSTAYNLSTASYDSVSFSVASQTTTPWAISFNGSGTKMYIGGFGSGLVYQYTLSTAYDISTASYDSVSLNSGVSIRGIFFKPDGTKLYVASDSDDAIREFSLSSPFDLSTASSTSVSFSVANEETFLLGFSFNSNGTKMYAVGLNQDTVYQYSTGTGLDPATFTYPASVKWAGGTAPTAPADGETDVLNFVTADGGTTYYGFKVGDSFA